MPQVDHDGRTTAYRLTARDDDPTCLFVHGSGTDRRVWKSQDRLAADLIVAALDLSGHGASDDVETEPGPATLEVYAADVTAVASAVDADVLVGNSLGGAVVQEVLLSGRYEPQAAVLVGTGAKLAVRADLREWLATDFDRVVEFLHGAGRLFAAPTDTMVHASSRTMYAIGRAVTERDYLTCHTFDVRERLDQIAVPTLAICGERDGLTPPRYHTYLATRIDRGVLSVVPNAAHLVMMERADLFNKRLCAFVQTLF